MSQLIRDKRKFFKHEEPDRRSLRVKSGEINSGDPMVSLLYTLMRDGHINVGQMESLVQDEIRAKEERGYKIREVQFTNGYLAKYAIDVAERFRNCYESSDD